MAIAWPLIDGFRAGARVRLDLRSSRPASAGLNEVRMKKVMKWTGGVLLALVVVAGTAHASTSAEAHENGDCVTCSWLSCMHSALFEAFHG